MTEIEAILYRWVNGVSQRAISRSLGVSRNTISLYVRLAEKKGLLPGEAALEKITEISQLISVEQTSVRCCPTDKILADYHQQVEQWLTMRYMTIKQIWRLLQEMTPPVEVELSSLYRYVHRHFEPQKDKITMVLPTIPGEQAQVDFGYVGLMREVGTGKQKKTYAFVMTLSHSRLRFVYFVFRQDTATWIDCHERAFLFFGGVPKTVLLDNLKAGVIKPDVYDPTINRSYAELEKHYGFIADPAKVRTPEHKGKVERSVTIVKQQVVSGREFEDIQQANDYAWKWCHDIIANEVTRTTGETPRERFERDEKVILLPLPASRFECPVWVEAKVGRDQHVTYRGSFYSVPDAYVGQYVSVRATLKMIRIYYNNQPIKAHVAATRKGLWLTDVADLHEAAQHFLLNKPTYCLNKAKAMGASIHEVITSLLQQPTTSRLRKAQAILRLAETYGDTRLEAACQRGLDFNNTTVKTLKSILQQGLDKSSACDKPTHSVAALSEGAFLREPSEFAQ